MSSQETDKCDVPARYQHLVAGGWDKEFLEKQSWVSWLDQQVQNNPFKPGEILVDYVRRRVEQSRQPVAAPAPAPSAPAPAPAMPTAVSSSSLAPSFASAPTVNGGGDDFSEMLDLTSYADETASLSNGVNGFSTAYTAPAASSFPASTTQHLYTGFPASPSPTPSPMSVYANGSRAFSPGPIRPFGAPVQSTLSLQSQLIAEERQRNQQAQQQQAAAAVYPHPASTNTFFDPHAFQQPQQQQVPLTVTPSALSTPVPAPVASTSSGSSSSQSKTPKKPSSRSGSPANPSSSSSVKKERVRTASPPVDSYDSTQWTTFLPKLRQHLVSKRIQGAALSTAQFLVKNLQMFSHTDKSSTLSPWGDASDVPPEGRAEVLSTIAKYGTEDFFKAWLDVGKDASSSGKGKGKDDGAGGGRVRSDGLELFQRWLDGAARGYASSSKEGKDGEKKSVVKDRKSKELEQASLAWVLQVLAKLPVTMDHLLAYPAPKLVKRISDRAAEGAVKAAATQLVTKWQKVQEAYRASQSKNASSSTSTATSTVKRKSDGADAPAKKLKTDPTKKPAAPPTALPIANKRPLPSFNKKKTDNPFLAALGNIAKKDGAPAASPAAVPVATSVKLPSAKKVGGVGAVLAAAAEAKKAAAAGDEEMKPREVKLGKNGKPKKSVRWKPDEELEAIREIEKAIYEDDENSAASGARVHAEGEDANANAKDMMLQEAYTLHQHLEDDVEMDEDIEYYEPVAVSVPKNDDFQYFHTEAVSAEREVQEQREAITMAVDETSTPPDTPAEPPEYSPDKADPEPRPIALHEDLANDAEVLQTIADAQASAGVKTFVPNEQLVSLLDELNGGGLSAVLPPQPQGVPPQSMLIDEATRATLRNYQPEQIEAIIRTDPRFHGLSLEQLGLAPQPQPLHPHPADPYQGYAPPPHLGGEQYHGGGGAPYGQPWQPPPAAAYVPPGQPAAWPPQPNYSAGPSGPPPPSYDGYVPPQHGGNLSQSTMQIHGPGQSGGVYRGMRKPVPCRFFTSPRGCDRGALCAFRHDM
ncbi:hypothetical protein JCM8547_008593 [Rhodosporidiobolus lusitaniae]